MADETYKVTQELEFVTKGDIVSQINKEVEAVERAKKRMERRQQAQQAAIEASLPPSLQARSREDRMRQQKIEAAVRGERMSNGRKVWGEGDVAGETARRLKQQEAIDKEAKTAELKAKSDRETIAQQRKIATMMAVSGVGGALSALPGASGSASLVNAALAGGPMGFAGAAAGQAVSYGLRGSQIADPAVWERLNYQADRLQAIMGRELSPVVSRFEKQLERFGDFFGGKGAQLNNPQFGDFASIRDRLQVAALEGLTPGSEGGKGKSLAKGLGAGMFSGMFSQEKTPSGKDVGDTIMGFFKGLVMGAGEEQDVEIKPVRGTMDATKHSGEE